MIAMRVQREPSDGGATLGACYVNDRFVCWTLEDVIRDLTPGPETNRVAWVQSWKQPGVTAVPAGRYDVVIEWSPRFQMKLPELKGIPGFSEVKFHAGNRHQDTEGCLLVGHGRLPGMVTNSRDALGELLLLLDPRDQIFIDIENPPGRHFSRPLASGEGQRA